MAWLPGMTITDQRLLDNTPRTISYTAITANTGTSTGTELVAVTTSSVTFRTGRAYRLTFKGLAQSSVAADAVTVRVRKTNISGDVYVDSFRLYIPAGGANVAFYLSTICSNSTVADVSAVLVGTFIRVAGSGSSLIAATGTHTCYIEVEDIGETADFPSARAIT